MAQNLAQRAQQASEQRAQAPALVSADDHPDSMERLIASRRDRFAEAMGIDPDQLLRDAVTAVRLTPRLRECTRSSVLGALMTAAQLRLRVGVLGHCWILPYWSKRAESFEASFVLGYQGLIELGDRAGIQMNARSVHDGDHFEIEYGTEAERLVHRPVKRGERGAPYGYYAIARSQSRRPEFHYMTQEEVILWRDRFANAESTAWRNNFDSMAKKTVLKQVARYQPKSADGDLAVAMAADAGVRDDDDPAITADVVTEHPYRDDEPDEQPSEQHDVPPADDAPEPGARADGDTGQAEQPERPPQNPQRRARTRKG